MASSRFKTYGLTLPVFAAGALASAETDDWTWFARSGAAVVAIGVFLTSREILEHNRRLRISRWRWEARLRAGRWGQDWADEDSLRRLARSRHREEELWESKFHGLHILIAGTLVWGFGDLIGRLFTS